MTSKFKSSSHLESDQGQDDTNHVPHPLSAEVADSAKPNAYQSTTPLRSAPTTEDNAHSPVSETTRAEDHIHVARDFAIAAAVMLYFVGFTYLNTFFTAFDIPQTVFQLSPQYVYMYAYDVIDAHKGATVFCALLFLVIAYSYHFTVLNFASNGVYCKWRRKAKLSERSRRLPVSIFVIIPIDCQRLIAMIIILLSVSLAFPEAYRLARGVAETDVSMIRYKGHVASPQFFKFTVADNILRSSPLLNQDIETVNKAGKNGNLVPVFETADRLYVFVGATPRGDETPYQAIPGDRVYVMYKSLVGVESIWKSI